MAQQGLTWKRSEAGPGQPCAGPSPPAGREVEQASFSMEGVTVVVVPGDVRKVVAAEPRTLAGERRSPKSRYGSISRPACGRNARIR